MHCNTPGCICVLFRYLFLVSNCLHTHHLHPFLHTRAADQLLLWDVVELQNLAMLPTDPLVQVRTGVRQGVDSHPRFLVAFQMIAAEGLRAHQTGL